MTTPAVALYSDNTWRYHCPNCQRRAGMYLTEAAAQHDANQHDCNNPKVNERTEDEWDALRLGIADHQAGEEK